MNSTGVVDKIYLALELTKIRYNGLLNADTRDLETDTNVVNTFLYYIEELTNIKMEKIDKIPELEKKLDDITNKYKMVCDTFNVSVTSAVKSNNERALEFLESAKGDMEIYAYKGLKDRLTKN